ncbi:VOC family protein [Myceligenerans pegani]|uniref:VOC family protein n=1 Tax=Myceligenerans pegani TaxID=2776917 RepID=A0ABR9MUU2_9MICO|nr:VOC family protein [Myceligenerans sp. TRM 65318]MBE1875147.1 VOC family protein [Myceligenerans sp. TRM 65318]MBE3017418.1 VOC family protein [Myceligenerans sp. TRM 65318]
MTKLNPYLSFRTEAREALEFYQSVLGGDLNISAFGDMPMPGMDDVDGNLVMHGQLDAPNGLTLMAADSPDVAGMPPYVAPTSGVTVALTGSSAEHEYIAAAFDKLSDGASDVMPFEKAPWGDFYGQLKDKFGISWMFDASTPESEAAMAAAQQG